MNEEIYSQDRFWVNLDHEEILWMYHNPDAVSGDQLVSNIFTFDQLNGILAETPLREEPDTNAYEIFARLAEDSRQYLSDYDMDSYEYDKTIFESEPVCTGTTGETLHMFELLYRAKQLINEYCLREFDKEADFFNMRKIGIAYTTTENGSHIIQVNANLIEHRTEIFYDDVNVACETADSLDEYVEKQLTCLSFDELVDIPDFVIDDICTESKTANRPECMQLFTFGNEHLACIEVSTYMCGGGLYLSLQENCNGFYEPYADITVNLPQYRSAFGCAFVDAINLPQAEMLIAQYRLGRPTGRYGQSGYCTYPEYRFDLEELRKYCLNPQDMPIPAAAYERSDERCER